MTDLARFDFAALRRRLLAWHRTHARDLPWKENPHPYRVWISEIMLQQTTVAAVVPYFERFLARFPTVQTLASADEADVLRLWEGLGYYSRARNLHKAANALVEQSDGEFPRTADALQELPGIGRYTAGAIASFAFDTRAPIVEANTLRLYCRLLGYDGDPRSTDGQRLLWRFAEDLLPKTGSGRVNQALMDLGATVCTPTDPDCPRCPLKEFCIAAADGTQATIPRAKTKTLVTELQDISVAVFDGKKVLVRQRPPGERWAGLWDFPRWTVADPLPALKLSSPLPRGLARQIAEEIRRTTGLTVEPLQLTERIRHSVTRYRIELFCFTAKRESGRLAKSSPFQWITVADLDDLPLSVTGRKFAKRLTHHSLTADP